MPEVQAAPDLADWRKEFEHLDRCPWPGPRPLRKDDGPHLLVGREQEKHYFRREVATYRLILLTGVSGVGKTSLLEAGLIPELEEAGFVVAFCRDWSGSAEQTDPVAFLADKVHHAFGETVPNLPRGQALFWALNESLREKCVLVFDQFEELIRDAPALTGHLFRLLIEINRRTDLRVVISFRSEFLHEMADLEAGVKAFTMSHVALKQIDPAAVREVILSANEGDSVAIKADAADMVAGLWRAARDDHDPDAAAHRTQVGLLHLQALLYVLAARAGGGPVEVQHVQKIQGRRKASELFVRGLELAVREKIRRCRAAAEATGLDRYLIEGTSRALVDAVRHLSSAGYKLVREVRDLMTAALGTRHETLLGALARPTAQPGGQADGPAGDSQLGTLLNVMLDMILPDRARPGVDLLGSGRRVIASVADKEGPEPKGPLWAARLHEGAEPASADPAGVSCGPMFGLAPTAVLIEELRRFVFALEWLRTSSLVRISTPGSGGAMVALIHDGFGGALERWAQAASVGPGFELTALTSPQGGLFDWTRIDPDEPMWAELDGTRGPVVPANLRWRGAWVRASFRQVTFVNCDLRGAAFDGCEFEGVSFVNCLLDGTMFTDCTIRGSASPPGHDWGTEEPVFVVDAGEDLVQLIGHYQGADARGSKLLSQLPGLPAIPLRAKAADALALKHERGGLVVYGGRVSSLIVRSCQFTQGGRLSVRHVAGSGFDVVEQAGGQFEFYGSSLRHLSFSPVATRRSGAATTAPDDSGADFSIEINGSVIAQAWLSSGLSGTLRAVNSMLLQVWNSSPEVRASAHGCSFYGLIGMAVDDECTALLPNEAPVRLADISGSKGVMERSARMDYRRDPSARSSMTRKKPEPAMPAAANS